MPTNIGTAMPPAPPMRRGREPGSEVCPIAFGRGQRGLADRGRGGPGPPRAPVCAPPGVRPPRWRAWPWARA